MTKWRYLLLSYKMDWFFNDDIKGFLIPWKFGWLRKFNETPHKIYIFVLNPCNQNFMRYVPKYPVTFLSQYFILFPNVLCHTVFCGLHMFYGKKIISAIFNPNFLYQKYKFKQKVHLPFHFRHLWRLRRLLLCPSFRPFSFLAWICLSC